MDGGGAVAGTSLGEGGNGRQTAGRTGTDGLSHGRTGRRTAGRAESLVRQPGGRTALSGGRTAGRADGRAGAAAG